MKRRPWMSGIVLSLIFVFIFTGCGISQSSDTTGSTGKLKVVATTTFVRDVVSRVGGDEIELTGMLPYGANPHAYQPTPQDVAAVNEADAVFANGVNLEVFLDDLIQNAGGDAQVVHVSEGIDLREFVEKGESHDHEEGEEHDHDHDEGDGHGHDEDDGHEHGSADPHVWFDPNNILVWVDSIEDTLVRLDPENAETYRENAEAYREELRELDAWIRDEVSQIPEENRELVTDHTSFGYFAEEYGFQQVGAVIPAPTTEAEPSGQQIAALMETIEEYDVKAIFVGKDFDPSLSQRVAEDTGVELVGLYFGSLTKTDGPAGTYLDFMRYNVEAIVEVLQ